MSQLTANKFSKRGLAYSCLRCPPSEPYIAEKHRVEAHLWKNHLPLDQAPNYCTLCLYRCFDQKTLNNHIKSFPPHINNRDNLIKEGSAKPDQYYLKKSKNPYVFNKNQTDLDYRPLSQLESRLYWSTKTRVPAAQPTQPQGHASSVSMPFSPAVMPSLHSYNYQQPQPIRQQLPPAEFQHSAHQTFQPLPSAHTSILFQQPLASQSFLQQPLVQQPLVKSFQQSLTRQPLQQHVPLSQPSVSKPVTPNNQPMPLATQPAQSTEVQPNIAQYLPIDMSDNFEIYSTSNETVTVNTVSEIEYEEPFSPTVSSPVRRILVEDEKDEAINTLPTLLGEEAQEDFIPPVSPPVSMPTAASSTDRSENDRKLDKLMEAVSILTKSQELVMKELERLNKSVSRLSSDVSFMRGQVRQLERGQDRGTQVIQNLNTAVRQPTRNPAVRARPYRPRNRRQQPPPNRQQPQQTSQPPTPEPTVKSLVIQKTD